MYRVCWRQNGCSSWLSAVLYGIGISLQPGGVCGGNRHGHMGREVGLIADLHRWWTVRVSCAGVGQVGLFLAVERVA